MRDNHAIELTEAIKNWLEFQILCKREMLLSENYLAQPVGEYLRAIHHAEIKSEWTHPNFQNARRGRPKQIDYALFSRDTNRPISIIEAKWIGSDPTEKQRIVNDILRLECIRNGTSQAMTRYFLVAGELDNYITNFLNLNINTGRGSRINFVQQILPITITKSSISVRHSHEKIKEFFKSFSLDYNTHIPLSYKAELLSDITTDKIHVAIWKISSAKRRTLFNPDIEWRSINVSEIE